MLAHATPPADWDGDGRRHRHPRINLQGSNVYVVFGPGKPVHHQACSPYSEGLPVIKHIKFLLLTFNKKAHGNKRKASWWWCVRLQRCFKREAAKAKRLEDEHKKKELPGIKMMLLVSIAATPAFPTIPGSSFKRWCLNLPPNSVQNWCEMQNKFHQWLYRSEPDFENDDC